MKRLEIGMRAILAFLLLVVMAPFGVHGESVAEGKSAAERGDGVAQFCYVGMLRDGRGVNKNALIRTILSVANPTPNAMPFRFFASSPSKVTSTQKEC